jgi:DNA primase
MDFAEQVKASVDIVTVVGEHVRLRRSGAYRYMGLCPFHNEKTPSFTVHATHQFYKCFSCGAGGDVFKFVMEMEGLSFYEALKALAERHGIPIPKRSLYADEDSRLRGALFALHELAAEHFRANLNGPGGETARAYLAKRGLTPKTVDQFGLGYAERSGRSLLRVMEERGFTAAQMEQSGLVGKREDGSLYDRFRNRLMFPIHDASGRMIAFGGRALAPDDTPKYLNSPETPIYKKSRVLYNLHRAKEAIRKEDRVILVEGYMDAIGVTAAGFAAVVASCGTALTSQQAQLLRRQTQRIIVNFDPDPAGSNAAERSISVLLAEGMQVRILELEDGLDPDEYCKQRGAKAYEQQLERAKGYFYWLADRGRSMVDLHTTEGQVAALRSLLPAVQLIHDRMERLMIAGDVAAYLGIDQGAVLESFKKAASERQEKRFTAPKTVLRHCERVLLNALLTKEEVRAEFVEDLQSMETLASSPARRIFEAIFTLVGAGVPFGYEEIHARLEEGDQNLLAHAVLEEDEPYSREDILAAMERMWCAEKEHRRSQLKSKVKELERAGNWQEALRMMEELRNLERN